MIPDDVESQGQDGEDEEEVENPEDHRDCDDLLLETGTLKIFQR